MFFRLKKSGPRSYLQIVENRRDGRSVRQHVIATIGRIDELAARGGLATLLASGARFCEQVMLLSALDDPEQAARLSCKRIGGPLLFGHLWERRWSWDARITPHRFTPDGVGASAPAIPTRATQCPLWPLAFGERHSCPSGKVNDTVNLIGSGRDKAHEDRPHERLCPIRDHHTRHAGLPLQQLAEQALGGLLVPPALDENVEHDPILVDGPPEPVLLFRLIIRHTSSRCHLSPGQGSLRRIWLAKAWPNLRAHWRTVSWLTSMPRAASISSTMRRLSGKRK